MSNDNHPGADFYREPARDNNNSTSAFPHHANGVQFEDRRPDWYSMPSHPPMQEGPRSSYIGGSWRPLSSNQNFMAPVASKPRRPVQRISARISARPARSPSPSPSSASASSSSSTSYEHGSGSRHGSESRSRPPSPVRLINHEFQDSGEFRKSSPEPHPPAVSNSLYSSRKIFGSPTDDSHSGHLSSNARRLPTPPTHFIHDTQSSAHNTTNEFKKGHSTSPGPESVTSSIRSSPHSPPDLESAILPNTPADLPCISIISSDGKDVPDDDPDDGPDFELSGQSGGKSSLDASEPSKPNMRSDRSGV